MMTEKGRIKKVRIGRSWGVQSEPPFPSHAPQAVGIKFATIKDLTTLQGNRRRDDPVRRLSFSSL